MEQLQDIQLMRRVAAGDREAFARLFDRHAPVVLGVLVRMLRDRPEAEEIVQEAFLQAWREARTYRPERASPRGWLLLLARSRALDRLRSGKARTAREEAVSRQAPGSGGTEPVGTARLEAEERRGRVRAALATLPDEQRGAIELAFFSGLTHRQIAERLGEPLGTVKSRILLGMNKLRQALAP